MEKRLTSLHPRDEELEETIDALQKCNIERQEITKKYVEAKTSLNNLTKGFKARYDHLETTFDYMDHIIFVERTS